MNAVHPSHRAALHSPPQVLNVPRSLTRRGGRRYVVAVRIQLAYARRGLSLDLPDGLGADEAVAWNRSFGDHEGLILGEDGRIQYSAAARAAFAAHDSAVAEGFHIDDIEPAAAAMLALRRGLDG